MCLVLVDAVVRKGGLEPPRVAPPAPKAGASTNSATFAACVDCLQGVPGEGPGVAGSAERVSIAGYAPLAHGSDALQRLALSAESPQTRVRRSLRKLSRSRRGWSRHALRPAVVAIYRFARAADDIADEGDAPAHERLAALAALRRGAGRDRARRNARRTRPFPSSRTRCARTRCRSRLCHALLSAFRAGRHGQALRDLSPTLLDYCAALGQSGRPPAARALSARRRADNLRDRATRSAPGCSSPTSGRTWRSTGARAASTCRRRTSTASA